MKIALTPIVCCAKCSPATTGTIARRNRIKHFLRFVSAYRVMRSRDEWPFGMLSVELGYESCLGGFGRSVITTQLEWMKAQFHRWEEKEASPLSLTILSHTQAVTRALDESARVLSGRLHPHKPKKPAGT